MAYTVSDVLETYAGTLQLVAGHGGLARPVREVGILDYELMPHVKRRFQRVNFYEGQLVLSTFLYARDDPYFHITEAVKYLVSKGTSGLVIKNVFHLQVPDAAIRYANARNFPLFVTTSDDFLFDEVITTVDRALRQIDSADLVQHEIDRLLQDRDDTALTLRHARTLNPSLHNEHRALFVMPKGGLESQDMAAEACFAAFERRFCATELASYTNLFARYDDGLLMVVSGDRMVGDGSRAEGDAIARRVQAEVLEGDTTAAVGLSEAHYLLSELPTAIDEALRASRFAARQGGGVMHYADLGTYRILLPHLASPDLTAFVDSTLEPLRVYDAENNAELLETLRSFCENGQSFARTAQATGQHENTVRRRLDRIAAVTGLSFKNADHMEQLSLAIKIEQCREIMGV